MLFQQYKISVQIGHKHYSEFKTIVACAGWFTHYSLLACWYQSMNFMCISTPDLQQTPEN